MCAKTKPTKVAGELHPTLSSMTIAFWRTRLLVERKAKTFPLRLLVLSMISSEEGIHPGEIRGRLDLDFSRITRLIQSLEKEGFLFKERDTEDLRFFRMYPTEKGREYLRERTELTNKEFQERIEGLSPAEVEELNRMLHVVAEEVRL